MGVAFKYLQLLILGLRGEGVIGWIINDRHIDSKTMVRDIIIMGIMGINWGFQY